MTLLQFLFLAIVLIIVTASLVALLAGIKEGFIKGRITSRSYKVFKRIKNPPYLFASYTCSTCILVPTCGYAFEPFNINNNCLLENK
jgi:hypothetical protein